MNPPREPDGWRNRRRIMVAVPDQNLILMENFINPATASPASSREQQIWTYRDAAPGRPTPPPPPAGVRRDDDRATGPRSSGRPAASPDVTGYRHRAGRGGQALARRVSGRWAGSGRDQTSYHDRGPEAGTVYHYAVRAVGADGRRGAAPPRSGRSRGSSRTSSSRSSPPARCGCRGRPPAGRDVVGYHVERAVVEVLSEDQIVRLKKQTRPLAEPSVGAIKAVGPFSRLTREPVTGDRVHRRRRSTCARPQPIEGEAAGRPPLPRRPARPEGQAVPLRGLRLPRPRRQRAGRRGGRSPFVLTIPSAPAGLFSREDGRACHLKWAANPEAGLKGYRVYRMEGPRINGPGQPVTPAHRRARRRARASPTTEAGGRTRRYWVVAVDALGQEGFPSAPTWYDREYRSYYEPFVGEWHQ